MRTFFMTQKSARFLITILSLACLLSLASCNRSPLSREKLTSANYDQVTVGMSKTQVERILGTPSTIETKDMLVFKKTTYKYENGAKFVMITFKNDEVDGKDSNLGR